MTPLSSTWNVRLRAISAFPRPRGPTRRTTVARARRHADRVRGLFDLILADVLGAAVCSNSGYLTMSDVDFSAVDRRPEPIASHASQKPVKRQLVMKPESFFSLRFHLHVEDEEEEQRSDVTQPVLRNRLHGLLDLNLLLMILFVGVPILVYCILSSIT